MRPCPRCVQTEPTRHVALIGIGQPSMRFKASSCHGVCKGKGIHVVGGQQFLRNDASKSQWPRKSQNKNSQECPSMTCFSGVARGAVPSLLLVFSCRLDSLFRDSKPSPNGGSRCSRMDAWSPFCRSLQHTGLRHQSQHFAMIFLPCAAPVSLRIPTHLDFKVARGPRDREM